MGSVPLQMNESASHISVAERISAALDGEWPEGGGHAAQARVSRRLAEFLSTLDADGRALWTDYHLIGDALRSDELAEDAAMSAAFVARFSARLADEPHVLAPSALQTNVWRRLALRRRMLPVFAVAAAAATLSWVVVPQLQSLGGVSTPAQVASVSDSDGQAMQRVALTSTPMNGGVQQGIQEANIVRDADLAQYLAAHQQFAQQPMVQSGTPWIRAAAVSEGK
ncbi:sigma-E factor negative regulatory protein [Mycetohabitans sp. B8]|uniref:sigma-E factor negative regulatory protein n=1 Tax=Mycetohabitans sp. B8 TaxID=2841845 RepID=UPI001F4696E0|nr:sigma-E factor negative regulatory protein [Mycetohabitans sp. B8]MCG1041725.1 sigma-E factor negative regulatory protein [Mycetohabitans sp. B8]